MSELSQILEGAGNSMFFFGRRQKSDVKKKLKVLDEIHTRQVEKIDVATKLVTSVNNAIIGKVEIRHVTEAIAAATGALKR